MEKDKSKKIKDPVYGYISVPSFYMKNIVDIAAFQRLRRVIQTSYSPLYASALHNRFSHSLGVFHLGCIVAKRLKEVILEKKFLDETNAAKYANTYKLACLLHDVGHAPFSHTGEIYYKNKDFKIYDLHERLSGLVASKEFQKDLPGESGSAAPHEIMSAIIAIDKFGDIIGDTAEKELFARCITGYKYTETTKENQIKNCFISMLNSKVIDVDRLDYLIRDAYTSGFATTSIDYVRLLKAITIVCEKVKKGGIRYEIAYGKDAVSIIENVVYAHDAERKWIQNHPVVIYEAYILKCILENLNKQLNSKKNKLFSEQSLSEEGHTLKKKCSISLLCDDDIIYLAKNVFPNQYSSELFERNKRRHPVWKSEAEYKAYIGSLSTGGKYKEKFLECMESFIDGKISEHPVPMVINGDLIVQFEQELKDSIEKVGEDAEQIDGIKRKIRACKYLENYIRGTTIPFDFIVIPTSVFISNFSKQHLGETLIVFGKDNNQSIKKLKNVCNLLKSDSEDEKTFYYLFYRRGETDADQSGKIRNVEKFCEGLFEAIVVENREK